MTNSRTLYLASTSPRRRDLLAQLGLRFSVLPIEVDEFHRRGELPAAYVERLARDKAAAALARVGQGLVIAADTTVVLDGEVLGKPRSREAAISIWHRLSGREHQVLTGVAVASQERVESVVVTTTVVFHPLTETEMEAYWASGEPADKAGGYGIQGRGAVFVSRIDGSYSNVVGLPLSETAALLASFGFDIWNQ
jgi:septum formation protein